MSALDQARSKFEKNRVSDEQKNFVPLGTTGCTFLRSFRRGLVKRQSERSEWSRWTGAKGVSRKGPLKNNIHNVLEVVIFSKKPSYTNEQVIKGAESVTTILKSYPGFISRKFAENTKDKNQWVDIVHWASLHDALAAANKIVKTTQMKKFMSVMHSYKMYHFQIRFNATK
jgi:heme-degrading monooxygenase HmoA